MVWAVFANILSTPLWRQPLSFPLVPLNCLQKTGSEGRERPEIPGLLLSRLAGLLWEISVAEQSAEEGYRPLPFMPGADAAGKSLNLLFTFKHPFLLG